MNANEFKVMALLYVANIDGNIKAEEVKAIVEKTDNTTFETVNKMFSKMNDADILEYINENKSAFINSESDLESLINDCRAIISADERNTVMEEYIVKALERVLR